MFCSSLLFTFPTLKIIKEELSFQANLVKNWSSKLVKKTLILTFACAIIERRFNISKKIGQLLYI